MIITVIAELLCVKTVPISHTKKYMISGYCIYFVISILDFSTATLSFIISSQKNNNPSPSTIANRFLYLLLKRKPSHHIATSGNTAGHISNHNPKNHINASVNTVPTFIPMTILTPCTSETSHHPTKASISKDTA